MSSGYITGAKQAQTLGSNRVRKARKVKQKLTWRQRLRKWFNKDLTNIDEPDAYIPQDIETARFSSEGMRFQLYRASGGYVIETRHYDQKNDRNHINMYVITKDKDLGHELGKIITMESLR
jgi:hypothetical protein